MWESSEGGRQCDRENGMTVIVSEDLIVIMSEPSSNFAYPVVTNPKRMPAADV
jgi:hypothetical protein